MAVKYTLIESNTTDIPGAAATTINRGVNCPGGGIDELIFRFTTANTTNAILADFGNIVSSMRIVLNGSTVFDFRSGYASASNNAASSFGYFLNSLGHGRAVEVPGDTAKEAFFRIPIGRNVPAGVSRVEYTIGFAATAAAVASGTCQLWVRYNDNFQTTTTIANATSFTASGTTEQVVVRMPQGVPGTLAGLYIQNDSAADEVTQVRIISQSDFDIPLDMVRAFNGDLMNGVVYADDDISGTAQQFAISSVGNLFLPTFGLTLDDDVRLTVTTSAATTLTFTPCITSPVNGQGELVGRQTQPVVTNVASSVLDATTESA
jgi:hypothetical protein|tara:strand:+ start:4318 stop:5277 length:960 start_codon:yes stop_codon:yes gene_type:complete